jgi:aryl-alcohol dehydrogenase-like predicted oxidoreductase
MAAKRIASQREAIRTYEGFCSDVGRAPGEVALAWLRGNAAVTAPIIGPRTMEHLESALASLALDLTAEQTAALDRIWPGPGGPAPEAYAW